LTSSSEPTVTEVDAPTIVEPPGDRQGASTGPDQPAAPVAQEADPFADVATEPAPWAVRLAGRAALIVIGLVVIALLAWQFWSLHSDVHHLRTTNRDQQAQISKLQSDLADLHNSYTATITCLEGQQAQKSLCLQFVR
jgi:hypothetical protein